MQGSLRKEMWLPVLNDGGKVIGCIARSVSRSLPKKYYHPVVRVAVIYQGMLYLVNRGKKSFVSPDTIDYPFYSYVLFRHSIESTVRETMGGLGEKEDVMPRFLIRYTFENEKVKHLVNLYVMCVRSEKVMDQIKQPNGKLWTSKQIEENLGSYLPQQQTILCLFIPYNSLRFVIFIAAVCGLGAGRSNDAHICPSFPILNADFPVHRCTMGLYSLRSINSCIHSDSM